MSARKSKALGEGGAQLSVRPASRPEQPPAPRSTGDVSAREHANFVAFPNENWEEATPKSLRPAVCDLRENLLAMAYSMFSKSEQNSYEDIHDYRVKGSEPVILARHVDRLLRWLAVDAAVLYANHFRRIAAAHRDLVHGDPLNWAYAQIHSALYESLELPEGISLKNWLMSVCDGQPTDTSEDLISLVKTRLKRAVVWRAPVWVQAYLSERADNQYERESAWERLPPEMTQAVFAKFVRNFWIDLEAGLNGHMRHIRVTLAQQDKAYLGPREQSTTEGVEERETEEICADSSTIRAHTVQRVCDELARIRPRMTPRADYKSVKAQFPASLVFAVCDRDKELRLKLENIQEHHQFIRFAIEIVAAQYGRKFNTVQKDWKAHKPRKKSR